LKKIKKFLFYPTLKPQKNVLNSEEAKCFYQTHNSSTLKIEYQHILYLPSAVGKPTSYKSRATADVSSPQPVSL